MSRARPRQGSYSWKKWTLREYFPSSGTKLACGLVLDPDIHMLIAVDADIGEKESIGAVM
jgi:hypothetical protein